MAVRPRVLLVLASAVVVLAVYVAVQFRADMRVARAAVASYETIAVDTSFGSIELVDVGSGFPVLSIHGTGGGFDQGLALADGLLDAGYRVIASSRRRASGIWGRRSPNGPTPSSCSTSSPWIAPSSWAHRRARSPHLPLPSGIRSERRPCC